MDKKELQNKPNIKQENTEAKSKPQGKVGAALSGLLNKVLGIVKLAFGICLLPFVYSSSVAFLSQFSLVNKIYQDYFWAGAATFICVYFLIWEPQQMYAKGQRMVELVFSFFQPFVKVAPFLLPIYTIIIVALYYLAALFIKENWLFNAAIFLVGFTIILHLSFSAKTVRTKKDDFLKANYIFGFSFVYLVNIVMLSGLLSIMFKEFSLAIFLNNAFLSAKDILAAVFTQLFLK